MGLNFKINESNKKLINIGIGIDNKKQIVQDVKKTFNGDAIKEAIDDFNESLDQTKAVVSKGDSVLDIAPVSNGIKYKNKNVIDTNNTVYKGKKYNLTRGQLEMLAWVCYREQGSLEGAKVEASLMANLTESRNYSSVYSFVGNSGWFGKNGFRGYGSGSNYRYFQNHKEEYMAVVEDVLENGNRCIPADVVEHDCFSDISYATNNGVRINVNNRNSYIPGVTVIHNVYGATYVFDGFASSNGDPFGHLK